MGHLQPLDLCAMAAYAAAMLLIGWGYGKRQQTSDDYFVAGRGARSWIVGISMIAALFSTISFLSVPGELIRYGPGWIFNLAHLPITLLVVCLFIIPHIMKRRITSGYELLESRFGARIRKTASLLFIMTRLLWMGFVLLLCGRAVSLVTSVPLPYVLATIAIIATASTVMGGIRTVLLTDVIQFTIHVGSGVLVILYVTYQFGGMSWLFNWDAQAVATLDWPETKWFSLSAFDRITVVGAILHGGLWWICTATSDQMMIQRFLCTGTVNGARRSFINCMIGHVAMTLVLWGIAAALLAYFLRFSTNLPDAGNPLGQQADRLFPHFIATVLPTGVRGLIVAALFADAMQSLSSGISALGTVLVVDFKSVFAPGIASRAYEDGRQGSADLTDDADAATTKVLDYAKPEFDSAALARRAKVVGLAVGVVAVALSFVIGYIPGRNFLDVAYRLSGFFTVPLFVLFAMAFFVPFASRAGAWAAVFVGIAAGVLFSYWKQIVGLFMPTGDFSIMLILPLTLVFSLGTGLLVSLATQFGPVVAEQPNP